MHYKKRLCVYYKECLNLCAGVTNGCSGFTYEYINTGLCFLKKFSYPKSVFFVGRKKIMKINLFLIYICIEFFLFLRYFMCSFTIYTKYTNN